MKFVGFSIVLFSVYYLVLPGLILDNSPTKNTYAKRAATKKIDRLAKITQNDADFYLEDYLSERTRQFVATLGVSPVATTWYNDMHNPPSRWFGVDEARAEMKSRPLHRNLHSVYEKILQTRDYKGFQSGRFIVWNSMFALVLLFTAFMLYRWLPLSAFFSAFILYQVFFLFFVVWPRWRYLYFMYLGGLFLLPVVVFEINKLKTRRI